VSDYDVIIAGLGAMGSAAAYHLAADGSRVLGLDRFQPPHQLGSSHGLTRIIREAYFEHPSYVPLVQRAYELWAELEKNSGRRLLQQTGGVMIGPPGGALVGGARRSAEEHRLRHELLSSAELRRRFPVFHPATEMIGVWEPRAGVLFPEAAVQAHLELAAKRGATLRFNEPVLKWKPHGEGVRVQSAKRAYTADQLLLAAGAWTQSLAGQLNLPLAIERQVLYWFEPRSQAADFQPQQCPIHIWEHAPRRYFYGFPELGDGVKVAVHHEGEPAQPETVRREVSSQEIEAMRTLLRRFLPAAEGRLRSQAVCLYTNTPDEHFILDRHPQHPQVLVASPCSGHGFKFSSVIGELVAKLLRGQRPAFDLSLFRISRFVKN
jgi:sarcosine oxidase